MTRLKEEILVPAANGKSVYPLFCSLSFWPCPNVREDLAGSPFWLAYRDDRRAWCSRHFDSKPRKRNVHLPRSGGCP